MSWKDILNWNLQPEEETVPLEPSHTHEWQQKAVTYAPPRRDVNFSLGDDSRSARAALMGMTTLLEECLVCHEPRVAELFGSSTTHLDEMLDKAEIYGPQYLQRNNITFLIQRYQAQTPAGQPPIGQLPIR